MIVTYPTALYNNVLPQEPDDGGNVTFTISNSEPPRTSLLFPKIAIGIQRRRRIVEETTLVNRRGALGGLAFTVNKASRDQVGNTARQYEVGQILEFGDESAAQSVSPMLVADETEAQHDTNVFDYDTLGISSEEIQLINDKSLIAHDQLSTRLNQLRVLRSDAEIDISTNQKLINEANRNIAALQAIIDNSGVDHEISELITKFERKRMEAQQALDMAITNANAYASEASELLNDLRKVATVLK